ncbi:MAG: hygromycin-B 7''-O-kinase [Candidatus Azotimanducaceae bacterium]|jgi:hygromycin-B 7''-O-kinase
MKIIDNSLPKPNSGSEYDKLDLKGEIFRNAVNSICQAEGISSNSITTFTSGSCPVFGVNDQFVVKMFAPVFEAHFIIEKTALGFLGNSDFNYAPVMVSTGTFSDWPYIIMQKVEGRCLSDIWLNLTVDEKMQIVRKIGSVTKEMHNLSIEDLPPTLKNWNDFIRSQGESAFLKQKENGLDEQYLEEIPSFLKSVELPQSDRQSFLHTELMRDHIFVERTSGEWRITGIIDFEPSTVGNAEYDFASVGLFITQGEPRLFEYFLEGYGFDPMDQHLHKRVMVYAILHRYSSLKWYLSFMPKGSNLIALSKFWFTTSMS